MSRWGSASSTARRGEEHAPARSRALEASQREAGLGGDVPWCLPLKRVCAYGALVPCPPLLHRTASACCGPERRSSSRTPSAPVRGKRPLRSAGFSVSALGSRSERTGERVTATSRTSQASRIVHRGSSQRDGQASGEALWGDLQRNAEARGRGGVGGVLGARASRGPGEGPPPVGSPKNAGPRM